MSLKLETEGVKGPGTSCNRQRNTPENSKALKGNQWSVDTIPISNLRALVETHWDNSHKVLSPVPGTEEPMPLLYDALNWRKTTGRSPIKRLLQSTERKSSQKRAGWKDGFRHPNSECARSTRQVENVAVSHTLPWRRRQDQQRLFWSVREMLMSGGGKLYEYINLCFVLT